MKLPEPQGQIVFHDYQLPEFTLGTHGITASLALDPGTGTGEALKAAAPTLKFHTTGLQLSLPPGAVCAHYPAANSAGDFAATLPHISLRPAFLPWLRKPSENEDPPAPWLVLLVLDESELNECTLGKALSTDLVEWGVAVDDTGSSVQVPYIEMPQVMARACLPGLTDLPWLAHTRSNSTGDKRATIIAQRTPKPDSLNHAFLISVENRYGSTGLLPPTDDEKLRFVVLHRFAFQCQAKHEHSFHALLAEAGKRSAPSLNLMLYAETEDELLRKRLAAGLVPMAHADATGQCKAAWYHGPLVPLNAGNDRNALMVTNNLPAMRPQTLMTKDNASGAHRIGYAAAWELGRLIALEHGDIAAAIYAWKRHFVQSCHHHSQPEEAELSHLLHPVNAPFAPPADCACLPASISDWIDGHLFNLLEVPFSYLVPDEAMLPANALRFFKVDGAWLDVLRDGALCIGRSDRHIRQQEVVSRAHLPAPPEMSGFILRSALVADFPDLEIEAYAMKSSTPLRILRRAKLSDTVLLVLFDGKLEKLDLHLHPTATHFELTTQFRNAQDNNGLAIEALKRQLHPTAIDFELPTLPDSDQDNRRVKFFPPPKSGAVAEFAASMLAKVPYVRFEHPEGQ